MNILSFVVVVWLALVSLAVAVDIGPEIYREKKARARLQKTVMRVAAQREARKPEMNPDETMKLGVFTIEPVPVVHRRHARA